MPRPSVPGLLLLAAFLVGCASTPPVEWTDKVATAAPEAVANQEGIARGPNSVTLLPISPRGAVIGVPYRYDMPHCGVASPIDVDGSFWDAVDVGPDPTVFDMQVGTFRLTSATTAEFTASDGRVLRLIRHEGAKAFGLCD